MNKILENNLITTKDAAALSGYTTDYLARLVRAGKIHGQRIGHSWLIQKDSLTNFLDNQEKHKIEYIRFLARSREEEYLSHQKSKKETIPKNNSVLSTVFLPNLVNPAIKNSSIQSQFLAFSLALLVVTFGAVAARVALLPQVAYKVLSVSQETALGFNSMFGSIPNTFVANVVAATAQNKTDEVSAANYISKATSGRTISLNVSSSAAPVQALLSNVPLPSSSSVHFSSQFGSQPPAPAYGTQLSLKNIEASILGGYQFLQTPAEIPTVLANAYSGIGTTAYDAIQNSLLSYQSLIWHLGNNALTLGINARDIFATTPNVLRNINLAIGHVIVNASHAAIRADVAVAYDMAALAPKTALTTVMFLGDSGDRLAALTSQVPPVATTMFLQATQAPAQLAPQMAQAIFSREYDAGLSFNGLIQSSMNQYMGLISNTANLAYTTASDSAAVTNSSQQFLAQAPVAIENAYLGMIGKGAVAIDSVASQLSSIKNQTSVLAAALPTLSVGEQAALVTYQTINSLFNSTTNALATLFETPTVVVGSNSFVKPTQVATSTSTRTQPSTLAVNNSPHIVTNYPTYTTVVNGVSSVSLNQSLASLRNDILATVAGMIQPVATQGATNETTIQQVNMIQNLSGLNVTDGNFEGGTFDNGTLTNGISVAATTGDFTNLTGGATSLATTTINGSLSTTGDLNVGGVLTAGSLSVSGVSSGGAIAAPYFTATSTTATSTFNGSINVGSGGFVYATSTRNVGIGVLSPAALLAIQNSTSTQPIFVATNAAGNEVYRITDSGFVGIGTTSPSQALSVQGNGLFSGNISAANITATGTLAVATNLAVGTTTTNDPFELYGSNSSTNLAGGGGIFAAITNADQTAGNFDSLSYREVNSAGSEVTGTRISGVFDSHIAGAESADLAFITRNLGTLAERVRITAAGLLGIGTTSPSQALSVQGNGLFSGNISAANITATGTLAVGLTNQNAFTNAGTVETGNVNSYYQHIIQNLNSGSTASADYIVGGDNMTDSSYYGDLGYNSSVNADPNYTGFGANDLYLYNNDQSVDIATASTTNANAAIKFFTGGTLAANQRMTILSTGLVGINTATPGSLLQIAGNTTPASFGQAVYLNIGNSSLIQDAITAGSGVNGLVDSAAISRSTLSASNTSVTTTQANSLEISGGVIAGTNETIGTDDGLYIRPNSVAGAGTVNIAFGAVINAPIGATNNYAAEFAGGDVSIGSAAPVAKLFITGAQSQSSWTTTGSNFATNASTLTDTSSTIGSTIGTRAANSFGIPTFAFNTGTSTITNAANLYIGGAPKSDSASSTIITNSYALDIAAGSIASGAVVTNGYAALFQAPTGATNNYAAAFTGGFVGIGTVTPDAFLNITGTQAGTPGGIAGAVDALDASGGTYTDNNTAQGGTASSWVSSRFGSPVLAATNPGVITPNAYTLYISGQVRASQNEAITNSYAEDIVGTATTASTTNAYGLSVVAPSGATNNYAAVFTGGNVGIGTAAPVSNLQINRASSQASWTTVGAEFSVLNNALTDNTTAAGSVIATRVSSSFAIPTFKFTNATSTITSAANLYISGAPTTDPASSLITNSSALLIAAGTITGTTTTSYGLTVNAQSNPNGVANYAANFMGGNVGIGTANPAAQLNIAAAGSGTPSSAGSVFLAGTGTYTDNNTAGSGVAVQYSASSFFRPTLAATNSSVTTTNATNLELNGPIIAGSNETIGTDYGLLIQTGGVTSGGAVTTAYGLGVNAPTGATNNYSAIFTGNVGIGVAPTGSLLTVGATLSGTPNVATPAYFGSTALTYTDNNTAASGVATGMAFFGQSSYTLAATNASVTTTNADGYYIRNAPRAGTNETLTNSAGMYIDNANSLANGGTVINGYGLQVVAPTGATNNYAAAFTAGSVGIGTSTPNNLLTLANAGANDQLSFIDTGASANQGIGTIGFSRGQFNFNTENAAYATTTRVVIASSGDVGIGTNAPTAQLMLSGGNSGTPSLVGLGLRVNTATYTDNVTSSGTTGNFIVNSFDHPSIAATNSSITTTAATNVFIAGAPSAAANETLTNAYGLFVAGNAISAGTTNGFGLDVQAPTGATNNYAAVFTGGNVGVGTSAPASQLQLAGSLSAASWTAVGLQFATNNVNLTDTSSALGTTIATRTANTFGQPTLKFSNATSTITNAATLYILGAPKGDPSTSLITNSSALLIAAGAVVGTTTTSYGLTVNAQTNASGVANYAADFLGGNVGIGIATPTAPLVASLSYAEPAGGIASTTAAVFSNNNVANATTSISILSRSSGMDTINFGSQLAEQAGYIDYAFGSNITGMTFGTALNNTPAVERMKITTSGLVGVGSTTPWGQLSASSTSAYPTLAIQQIGAGAAATFLGGSVGIGSTTPWRTLSVTGTMAISAPTLSTTGDYLCWNSTTDEVEAGSTNCTVSTEKVKNSITPLASVNGLTDLLALQPVSFRYDQGFGDNGSTTQLGFIAEQTNTVNPLFAEHATVPFTTPNGTVNVGDPSGINWNAITAASVLAIQQIEDGVSTTAYASSTPAMTINALGNIGIGTTTPQNTLTVSGDVGAIAFVNTSSQSEENNINYLDASSTATMLAQLLQLKVATYQYSMENQNEPARLGLVAEDVHTAAPEILSADGTGVDLYKLATFTLAGVQALAASQADLGVRVTSLESRVAKLESGAIGTGSSSPVSFSSSTLADALSGFDVLIQKGIAQFNTLAFHQLIATTDSSGASSAGSVTIAAGNTAVQVNNTLVAPTTKVFITFNAQVIGSWWVSQKTTGSFSVLLSAPQASDVSFDYFLVQTEGQIATSSPDGTFPGSSSNTNQNTTPDTIPPVITLLGPNPLTIPVGQAFEEPGVQVTDNVDGTDPYITFVNGIQQDASSSTIDTSSATTYIITYKATDQAGNSSTVHRAVVVGNPDGTVGATGSGTGSGGGTTSTSTPADTTPPVVTLNGAAAIQLTQGDTFTDPGATASDSVDGDITSKIQETGTVDTSTPGLYNLTYSVTDAAGNSGSASRVVTVVAADSTASTTTP